MYLACFNWVLFLGSSKSEIKVFLCVLMSSLVIEGSTPELFQLVSRIYCLTGVGPRSAFCVGSLQRK